MRKLGSPRGDAFWVNFVTNLSGERIGVLPYERMDVGVLDATPELIHNIPQPDFEAFVANELDGDPNVEIRKGLAYITSTQTDGGVSTTVEERATGVQWTVLSRYVLACDGAKSTVRKDLGIQSEGEDGYETMMTIHFQSDLRPVVKDRVGMLHWITDPACSGFIIAYDLGENQVLISNFDSKRHPVESWNESLCRDVVGAAIGQDIPFKVLSHRPWLLSRKVAKQYRQGGIFLVGDAAHSFPPTGGLGLNCGIADAHNITCKISAVLNGWARPDILDQYEAERRHIALICAAQSVKNGKKIFSFLKTLGTAGIDDVEEARANLHKSIHDPAKQEMIATEVAGQQEHFDNLELHIGYVYGDKSTPPHASHYTPKFVPGARLPHAWITPLEYDLFDYLEPHDVSYVKEFSLSDIAARRYSTLDLVKPQSFALIAGPGSGWKEKVEAIQQDLPGVRVLVRLYTVGVDFDFVFPEQERFFTEAALASSGALLVRPDQHIVAKLSSSTTADVAKTAILSELGL
ncbi:hypothetical protein Sste5346_008084 [Sporothrix stenoceras]|uniref:FAD-binding domain-containing protein n=1 Tax=Sporothrix stenoceras TaxID=5173 RepID=A0ABR3YS41_9PEZI